MNQVLCGIAGVHLLHSMNHDVSRNVCHQRILHRSCDKYILYFILYEYIFSGLPVGKDRKVSRYHHRETLWPDNSSRTFSASSPSTSTLFRDEYAPDTILIREAGTEKKCERNFTISALALPSLGGSRTKKRMLFLQGLYPCGKTVSRAPATTSREITVPSEVDVTASL